MVKSETRLATVFDIEELAQHMRAADAAEVLASGGFSPLGALQTAVRVSKFTKAFVIDGAVAALYGIAPMGQFKGAGAVWMLTSTVVDKFPLPFLRACIKEIPKLLKVYPVLVNAIDARYTIALEWAHWLGFAVFESAPFGLDQKPFHAIRITKEEFDARRSRSQAEKSRRHAHPQGKAVEEKQRRLCIWDPPQDGLEA